MKERYFLITLFLFSSLVAHTQLVDSIKNQLLKDWERSKGYTLDYLNTMPKDKYDYRPQDSIRTFAQQMLHQAHHRFIFA